MHGGPAKGPKGGERDKHGQARPTSLPAWSIAMSHRAAFMTDTA